MEPHSRQILLGENIGRLGFIQPQVSLQSLSEVTWERSPAEAGFSLALWLSAGQQSGSAAKARAWVAVR